MKRNPTTNEFVMVEVSVRPKWFPGCHSNLGEEITAENAWIILPDHFKPYGEPRLSIYLWHDALKAIRNANRLVVIGYSLPKSDILARLALSFAEPSPKRKVELFILNVGGDAMRVGEEIAELFLSSRDDVRITHFSNGDEGDYLALAQQMRR